MMISPFPPRSLFFAPMEGITDLPFRLAMLKAYPEWDYFCTDFLRVPASGHYPKKHIIHHLGAEILGSPMLKKKSVFQILTTEKAFHEETLRTIQECGVEWVDLNLGCPSRTVNGHGGGAYLLQDLEVLGKIIRQVRRAFSGTFTVKTRLGYHDDKNFCDLIKLFCAEGVEAITIHARTRDQLYHGVADWNYIEKAVKVSTVPIVGNGDIWSVTDVERIFAQTGCHSVMIGRGALKTPWLARLYRQKNMDEFSLRMNEIPRFFTVVQEEFLKAGHPPQGTLKRLKATCRFIFDDLPQGATFRRSLLFTQDLSDFNSLLTGNFATL